MSSDDLFAAEEQVIAAAQKLLDQGRLADPADGKLYQELLKDYQKLFRTTRRLMKLSDRNEQQLNALTPGATPRQRDHHAKEQGARRAVHQALEISLAADLPLDLHRRAECRDHVEPQEADHLLLRRGQFHRDHRQARIRGPHQSAQPLPHRDVEHCAPARRHHRQIYRRRHHGVFRRSGNAKA